MIEQLHNCPNCGAILDDTGRCNFCGSKVYDLFDIDVSNNRGIKYIRIKTDKGMIVAPIVLNTMRIDHRESALICAAEDGTLCIPNPDITISTEFRVVGKIIYEWRRGRMSDYTAVIHCEKCHRELARIRAYHEPDPIMFVPQDIMTRNYAFSSMFCQDCLNGRGGEEE